MQDHRSRSRSRRKPHAPAASDVRFANRKCDFVQCVPQPHRHPWAGVFEARRLANLHAAKFHPASGASLQHDHLQQAGRSG